MRLVCLLSLCGIPCAIEQLRFQRSLTLQLLFDLCFELLIFGLFSLDLTVQVAVMLVGSEEPGEETDHQACSGSIRSGKSATECHAFQRFVPNVLDPLCPCNLRLCG